MFAVFSKDTLKDHIYRHINIGPLWLAGNIGCYGHLNMGFRNSAKMLINSPSSF
jgi:hypothetical protein